MRKLLYYDIFKNKVYLFASFLCILVASFVSTICSSDVSVIEGSALLVISPMVADLMIIASSYLVFHAMFMKRFFKDDILVLSSINRKDIAFEPLLFIFVYAFIASYIVGMMTISGFHMIQHVCICFAGILITFSCVLSQWNAMNEHRGENRFISISSFIILIIYMMLYLLAPMLTWSYEACFYFFMLTLLICIILNFSFYRRYCSLNNAS